VLFDEIEKRRIAFAIAVGILDKATLPRRQSARRFFRTTMVIMTSNLGLERCWRISGGIGFAPEGVNRQYTGGGIKDLPGRRRKPRGEILAGVHDRSISRWFRS